MKDARKGMEVNKSGSHGSILHYLLLAPLMIGLLYGRNLSGDVWWHLKTGQWMVENRSFPFQDPFSYTTTRPVVLHEWGWEVIAWFLYSLSPSILVAASLLLISLAFYIAFGTALRRSSNAIASIIVIGVGLAASAGASEMRPHMLSFVLFAVSVVILNRYREHDSSLIWIFVPMAFVWSNMHGVFILGLALLVFEAVILYITPPEWALDSKKTASGKLLKVFAASVLVSLINPNGIAPYTYPIHVMSHPGAMGLTSEWVPPDFHTWTGRSLLLLLGIAAVGLASLKGRPALRDFAYVALFGALSLMSRRNAPIFAILCAGPLAVWLASAIDEARSRVSLNADRWGTWAAWGMIIVFAVSIFCWRVSDSRGFAPFDYMNMSEVFPAGACTFIEGSKIPGPMFNDYNYGGYLIWKLWPRHRVFVDSRQAPFLNGTFEETQDVINSVGYGTWQRVFEKYEINFAILNPSAPLVSALADREDWVQVYTDDKAVVFIRNTPENEKLVRTYCGS